MKLYDNIREYFSRFGLKLIALQEIKESEGRLKQEDVQEFFKQGKHDFDFMKKYLEKKFGRELNEKGLKYLRELVDEVNAERAY